MELLDCFSSFFSVFFSRVVVLIPPRLLGAEREEELSEEVTTDFLAIFVELRRSRCRLVPVDDKVDFSNFLELSIFDLAELAVPGRPLLGEPPELLIRELPPEVPPV